MEKSIGWKTLELQTMWSLRNERDLKGSRELQTVKVWVSCSLTQLYRRTTAWAVKITVNNDTDSQLHSLLRESFSTSAPMQIHKEMKVWMKRLSSWVSGPNQYFPRPKGLTWLSEFTICPRGTFGFVGNGIYIKCGQQLSVRSNENQPNLVQYYYLKLWLSNCSMTDLESFVNSLAVRHSKIHNVYKEGLTVRVKCIALENVTF